MFEKIKRHLLFLQCLRQIENGELKIENYKKQHFIKRTKSA